MSHHQIPYDPLLDTTHIDGQSSRHSTSRSTAHALDDHTIFIQPTLHIPSTPNSYATGRSTPVLAGVGPRGGGGSDFAAPYSDSTIDEDGDDRQSGYGSVAPLQVGTYRGHSSSSSPRSRTGGISSYPPNGASPGTGMGAERYRDEPSGRGRAVFDMVGKDELYEVPRVKSRKKGLFTAAVLCGGLIVVAAVLVPVYFFVIKKSGGSNGGGGGGGGGGGVSTPTGSASVQVLTTGGDGSTVTKKDGTTFLYNNTFGGYWVYDVNNPLNESARAQSYTPPLNEPWKWGVDRIYGVNLGGWLNLEPFISPALYEPFFPQAVDEWTLSTLIQQRDGNLDAIANHYATFIVEEDFAQIAAAGLNWVRIALPFWAIETYPNEPFLARASWTYFLKAMEWARKYGLRINLDFHAAPGSQNGWNHSGKLGPINFLNGVMGVANAQRALDYIRILAEFISQPEYKNVVPFFGILNEPNGYEAFPQDAIKSFYAQAYTIIRNAGGSGAGNGPVISIHEAFYGMPSWTDFLPGADRLALDSHPYLIFAPFPAGNPSDFVTVPCSKWSQMFGDSQSTFGITVAGEWSNAINDCGLYFTDVGKGTRYEGSLPLTTRLGDCAQWNDYTTWDQSIKDGLKEFSKSTMDALGDSFFWTWKIGESLAKGRVEAPFWSYKLAIQEGWAVTDPRTSKGQCQRIGSTQNSFMANGGTYGGAKIGVGVVDAIAEVQNLRNLPWPPTAIGGFANAATLPTYTATGPVPTLPVNPAAVAVTGTASVPSATASVSLGSGWANPADQGLMHVPIPNCAYPDPWNALAATVPVC